MAHSLNPRPVVTAAPHRIFFLLGAIQLVVAIAFWLVVLSPAISAITLTSLAVFGWWAHVFLMLYGLFTFFVFGFLMTVFPRWLGATPVARGRYTLIAVTLAVGIIGFYVGLFCSHSVLVAGVAVFVVGWLLGLVTLFGVWRASVSPSKRYALFPFSCVSMGCGGAIVYLLWLLSDQSELLTIARTAGLWLYLVPLIVAVSYRMLPFFSSRVLDNYTMIKPGWTLPVTMACVVAHFVLLISGAGDWTVFPDIILAALAAWHSLRWQLFRSLRVPLLGVLHVSFAWLSIAMVLFAVQSVLRLAGASFDLNHAPLHALGIGYISGMVIAMASRVSLGHSGRMLVAEWATKWAFVVIQFAAILRVLADVPPFVSGNRMTLILCAGAIWLLAFVPWSIRFGLIYVRPRIDGRSG